MAKKALRDTILVTGASGSVGRAIVADLLACGYSVRATDLHDRPLDTQHPDLEFVATDLRDHSAFPKLLNGVTRVIHAAAASSVALPWASLRSINVDATTALFDAASQQGVSAFVFLSSASVYQTQRRRIKETDPLEPLDPFARSKFAAERGLLRAKQAGAATKLVVIRPALTLGPHSTALMASLATAPHSSEHVSGSLPDSSAAHEPHSSTPSTSPERPLTSWRRAGTWPSTTSHAMIGTASRHSSTPQPRPTVSSCCPLDPSSSHPPASWNVLTPSSTVPRSPLSSESSRSHRGAASNAKNALKVTWNHTSDPKPSATDSETSPLIPKDSKKQDFSCVSRIQSPPSGM